MKKIFVILTLMGIVSCGRIAGPATPAAQTSVFLPGECLASAELKYSTYDGIELVHDGRYTFGFTMDLDNHQVERTDDKILALNWRDVPSDALFDNFGINRNAVKEEYEEVFNNLSTQVAEKFHKREFAFVTVLYNGGISLTADKDFAGFKAGEDLSPLITCTASSDLIVAETGENPVISTALNTPCNEGGFLNIPMDYITVTDNGVAFSIPVGEHDLTNETVIFDLNIPVKVVYYLQWLNDRLTDPDAPVPYKEEVLHCRFSTPLGLR